MLLNSPHDWLLTVYSDIALQLLKKKKITNSMILSQVLDKSWSDVFIKKYYVKIAENRFKKILGIFDSIILAYVTVLRGRGMDFFDFASYPSAICHIIEKENRFDILHYKHVKNTVKKILSSKNILTLI